MKRSAGSLPASGRHFKGRPTTPNNPTSVMCPFTSTRMTASGSSGRSLHQVLAGRETYSVGQGLTLIRVGSILQVFKSYTGPNVQGTLFAGDLPHIALTKAMSVSCTAILTLFLWTLTMSEESFPRLSHSRLQSSTVRGPTLWCTVTQSSLSVAQPNVTCEPWMAHQGGAERVGIAPPKAKTPQTPLSQGTPVERPSQEFARNHPLVGA
jgi:hypothetical protein